MTDIVIVAAARTAVGKFGGTLARTPASELGATVIRALLERARLDGGQIGEVILGQVLQAGTGQNPARQSVVKAGLPHGVPAMTINKVCGSGLKRCTRKWAGTPARSTSMAARSPSATRSAPPAAASW
jgi:acetyl-CoA C-acetyltransferase